MFEKRPFLVVDQIY